MFTHAALTVCGSEQLIASCELRIFRKHLRLTYFWRHAQTNENQS